VPTEVIAVAPGVHTFEAQRGDRHKRVTQEAPPGKVVRVVFREEDLAEPVFVAPVVVNPVMNVGVTTPSGDAAAEAKTWPPVGAWVLGGIGLAGIGVAIGFAVDAKSQANTLSSAGNACANPSSAACTKTENAKSANDRDHVIEAVGFAAGGAAIVGGILWAVLSHQSGSAASATSLVPDLAPGRAGLTLHSTF
jgi:hypothetical protein